MPSNSNTISILMKRELACVHLYCVLRCYGSRFTLVLIYLYGVDFTHELTGNE